jgi:creatinine amidohydrolase
MSNDPRWAALTFEEVAEHAASGAVAILPVGATEQHGPHLVTGTDSLFAERVAVAAAGRTGDIVLPTLAYGCSLGHTDRWAGTVSVHPTTLTAVVVELVSWVYRSGFRKLVLLNSHATNGPPCQSAILQLRHEFPDLRMRFISNFDLSPEITARYVEDAGDFHANEAETSLMLHLDRGGVREERVVDEPDRTEGRVFQYPMPAVTASGVVGRPSAATEVRGAELFSMHVDAFAALLERARQETDPQL